MSTNEIKLNEIALDAHKKRSKLISMYKKQGRGNVVLNLKHGCTYIYGETIKIPQISFGMGNVIDDMEFWSKTIWCKK